MTDELACPNCGEDTLKKGGFVYIKTVYFEGRVARIIRDGVDGFLCINTDCYSFYPKGHPEVKEEN